MSKKELIKKRGWKLEGVKWHWHWYDVIGFLLIGLEIYTYLWSLTLPSIQQYIESQIYVTDAENIVFIIPMVSLYFVAMWWALRVLAWRNGEIK